MTFGLWATIGGGVAGFILCVRRPDLVSRYLALNTGHLWPRVERSGARNLHRFAYQWVLAAPGVGRLAASQLGRLPAERGYVIAGRGGAWSPEDTRIMLDQFREPERAWASVQTYRSFLLREIGPMLRGRYRSLRLHTPTLWLHGLGDVVIRPEMLRGYEPYADEIGVELVKGAGHFIHEERPDFVLERALKFFA